MLRSEVLSPLRLHTWRALRLLGLPLLEALTE